MRNTIFSSFIQLVFILENKIPSFRPNDKGVEFVRINELALRTFSSSFGWLKDSTLTSTSNTYLLYYCIYNYYNTIYDFINLQIYWNFVTFLADWIASSNISNLNNISGLFTTLSCSRTVWIKFSLIKFLNEPCWIFVKNQVLHLAHPIWTFWI